MTWPQIFVMIAFVAVCFFLIVIILLQKGRGGGLAGAFGGTSGSAFGAKTGDVFTWITVAFAGGYLFLAVLGNFTFRPNIVAAPTATVGPVGGINVPVTPAAPAGETPVTDGPVLIETSDGEAIEVTPGVPIEVTPGAEGSDNLPIQIVPRTPGDEGDEVKDIDSSEELGDGGTGEVDDSADTPPPIDEPQSDDGGGR